MFACDTVTQYLYECRLVCYRVTQKEMAEHLEFDIDGNGEVSEEEARARSRSHSRSRLLLLLRAHTAHLLYKL